MSELMRGFKAIGLKKRDGAKTSEATAPKYASGNPFAALAMARKR